MIPIRELLDRIRWDPQFGAARFEVGYYDRLEGRIVRVPFENLSFPEGQHFMVDVVAPDGAVHSVPLHRIRVLWRDGQPIWKR